MKRIVVAWLLASGLVSYAASEPEVAGAKQQLSIEQKMDDIQFALALLKERGRVSTIQMRPLAQALTKKWNRVGYPQSDEEAKEAVGRAQGDTLISVQQALQKFSQWFKQDQLRALEITLYLATNDDGMLHFSSADCIAEAELQRLGQEDKLLLKQLGA